MKLNTSIDKCASALAVISTLAYTFKPMVSTVEEAFEITGRGLLIVVSGQTGLAVGKEHSAKITCPDGSRIDATCYKEWLLRHQPVIDEREGFLLVGVKKEQVPIGSKVEFNEAQ